MKDFAIQYKPASNGDFDLNIEVRRNSESKIISGLLLGPTLEQNITCLLIAESGDYKGNPDLGDFVLLYLVMICLGTGIVLKNNLPKMESI